MGFLKKKTNTQPVYNSQVPTPIEKVVEKAEEIELYDPEDSDAYEEDTELKSIKKHIKEQDLSTPKETVAELREKIRIQEEELKKMKKLEAEEDFDDSEESEEEDLEEEPEESPEETEEYDEEDSDTEDNEDSDNSENKSLPGELTEEMVKASLLNHEQRILQIESRLFRRGL